MAQYYLDSSDFATATSIYLDEFLTEVAPNGFYSSCGIVRQQVNGVLMPYNECIDCDTYNKPVIENKLLDDFPGAAAAYSLRLLDNEYYGPAIRVRRASDDAEYDIWFNLNDPLDGLDIPTLNTFCAGTDGFVTIWYDQSGNNNDAIQTSHSLQPKIYDSVSGVETNPDNSLPALLSSDGTYLSFNEILTIQSVFLTGKSTSTGSDENYILGKSDQYDYASGLSSSYWLDPVNTSNTDVSGGSNFLDNTLTDFTSTSRTSGTHLLSLIHLNPTGRADRITADRNGSKSWQGHLQELVIYTSDQSGNRIGINTNINFYYNIYIEYEPLLLEFYPGAEFAYSLRKISGAYNGAAVRVRRASDNLEQDIGFALDGSFNESLLSTFCSGTNCFVVKWYDQSGNSNDAVQSSSSAQPSIYISGSGLIYVNGKPSILFNGIDDEFRLDTTGLDIGNMSSFFMAKSNNNTSTQVLLELSGSTNNKRWLSPWINSSSQFAYGYGAAIAALTTTADFAQNLHTASAGSNLNAFGAWLNNRALGTVALASGIDPTQTGLGSFHGANFANMNAQELIVYGSEQYTNKTNIESNINAYYGAYWDGTQTSILDTYNTVATGWSVRALNSNYTGPLIRVRRDSDNTELDIYAKYDGNLDTDSIVDFCNGSNGFIPKWYDQSGNSRDLVRTQTSNQGKIYDSTTGIVTQNGKPAISHYGNFTHYLQCAGQSTANYHTNNNIAYSAVVGSELTTYYTGYFQLSSQFDIYPRWANGTKHQTPTNVALGTTSTGQFHHLSYRDNNSVVIRHNASNIVGGTDTANIITYTGVGINLLAGFGSLMQEIIIFNNAMASSENGVEQNVNAYFSIY